MRKPHRPLRVIRHNPLRRRIHRLRNNAQTPSQTPDTSQTPDQTQTPDSKPDTSATPNATDTPSAAGTQTFSGTVEKAGDKYVLKTDAGKTYDIDHQDDVKKFDGKRVRVQGKLDATGTMIQVK
jgi:hypothetical protein